MDLEKLNKAITKTGFHLEYNIGRILRENGWHLISNRCYVDDLEGTIREIDLLAYKVSAVEDFTLYTVLIISCKKNESNAWALLARPVEKNDPNYNWRPFKGWSNHPALNYYISGKTWPHAYHDKLSDKCPSLFEPPAVDVFAFQEVHKANGTVQNDKAIFSSITSLMKAQSYEMSLLNGRQKDKKRVYQFNLISVIDSELVRIMFDGEDITSTHLESEDYLCRYILNKEEAVARIKFATANSFPALIKEYSNLHTQNKIVFSEYHERFYSDAYKVWRKSDLIVKDLFNAISPTLQSTRFEFDRRFERFVSLDIFWNSETQILQIGLHMEKLPEGLLDFINSSKNLHAVTMKALADIFHYANGFTFEEGIAF